MKIAVGSDHGGYYIKSTIINFLKKMGYEVEDCGCYDKNSCDYSVYGIAVGEKVRDHIADYGIVVCTSGVGISIAANKVKGVRCGLAFDKTMAGLIRMHNDCNVLALSGSKLSDNEALDIVETFLNTSFEGGRHIRRVEIINKYDDER